jgi:hypothetical protein
MHITVKISRTKNGRQTNSAEKFHYNRNIGCTQLKMGDQLDLPGDGKDQA